MCSSDLAGKPLDEDELVWYILHGLGSSYNSLKTAINANPSTSLSDLFSQLEAFDQLHTPEDSDDTSTERHIRYPSMETAGVRRRRIARNAYKPDLGRGWPVNIGNGESINSVTHSIGNGLNSGSVSDMCLYSNGDFWVSVSNVRRVNAMA